MVIFFIIFYIIPVIIVGDIIQISYRELPREEVIKSKFMFILYSIISLCPLINIGVSLIYLDCIINEDPDVIPLFRKYSIFKFLKF